MMARSPAQDLLEREMRLSYGPVVHSLAGPPLDENSWQLVDDQFLLRGGAGHYFHYRKGTGVTIERGDAADASAEALWLSGSVYSAVASINGFLPIHASAVCHDGKVYAVTGPSGAGKSTLVTALGRFGLPLFCDDTLILDLSDPERIACLPGHKRLKLTEEALGLTGAAKQEKVGEGIEKFFSDPVVEYAGGPLPLGRLIFLEEGAGPAIETIRGAERMLRLKDDHYTAFHFAAARQFDPQSHFAHLSRLATQIEMSRFIRPRDIARFDDGVVLISGYITGSGREDPTKA